jgi:hypothetical protein
MDLKEYFENNKGLGVIATADENGKVDMAIYSRPHVIDKETIAFIMTDKLTHKNLQSNSYASYMFVETGKGYKGKRLYLEKIKEETDKDIINSFLRDKSYSDVSKYLVYFKVYDIRPLVGDKE